jgi:plastocyanin
MTQITTTLTRNRMRSRVVLGTACLLAFLAPACSDSDSTGGDANTTVAEVGEPPAPGLTISGNSFSAASVTAATEFTITNNDSVGHTVTDDAGSFNVAVGGGASEPLIIPDPGTYQIHCEIHGSMRGTITVA